MAGVSLEGIANLSPDLQRAFQAAARAEQKPIQAMAENKAKVDNRTKLMTDIIGKVDAVKGMMPGLDSAFGIRELSVAMSDPNAISATADKRLASPGTHNIEILQLPASASAVSNGFPDKDETTFGTGYFSFTTGNGETKDFFIDEENATLEGLAKTINAARMGVKASVVNDQTDPDNPYRLVLVGEGTGTQKNIEYPEFYFMDGAEEFFIEQERPAQNGVIRYEGHEFQVPNSEVPDLIPGVTVNIKGLTEPGKPASLTISQDIPKTTEKVKGLVDKLNAVFSFIQSQHKMDEKTDLSQTLGGEFSLRLAEQRLRNTLTQNRLFDETSSIRSLGELGIQFQKDGTLKFDDKKFEAQINGNYEGVVEFLTGNETKLGLMQSLSNTLQSLTGAPGATLTSMKNTETEKSERIQKEMDKKEKVAEKKQEELKMKLSRMQGALNSLQRQGANLAAQGMSGSIESLLGK